MHQRHGRGCFFSLLLTAFGAAVTACAHRAELPVQAGVGAEPVLPSASPHSLPTVNIAPATRPPGEISTKAARGCRGSGVGRGPRPPALALRAAERRRAGCRDRMRRRAQAGGIKAWIMGLVHEAGGRRRCRAPTASPCCATPTAMASRGAHGVSRGLHSPFGMALVGNDLYVANTDAVCASPIRRARRRIDGAGRDGHRPAGRADQPSLDQEHHRRPDGARLYVTRRLEQQCRRERPGQGRRPRGDLADRPADRAARDLRLGPAQSQRSGLGAARPAFCGRWSTSATSSAATWSRTT